MNERINDIMVYSFIRRATRSRPRKRPDSCHRGFHSWTRCRVHSHRVSDEETRWHSSKTETYIRAMQRSCNKYLAFQS